MTFELATVFAEPPLIQSLAAHAEKRQTAQATDEDDESHRDTESGNEIIASTLFLRVAAAADYFTTNITLMNEVPPVYVDLILDAYIFNVFPQSLVPTGVYLLILAVGAWYLSRYIHAWLHSVAVPVDDHKKTS